MFGAAATVVTKALRSAGQSLDKFGRILEVNPYVDTLLPSTRAVAFKKTLPTFNGVSFVAPNATVIGNVSIGAGSTVWYGAIIRGDVNTITIGKGVSIGDRVMINSSNATVIGDNAIIGSGAILHGCIIENDCMIGEGAQVLDGAKVQSKGILGPGSILSSGKIVPTGQLWAGIPAAYIRPLTTEEMNRISILSIETSQLGLDHAIECAKTWQQIEQDEYVHEQVSERNDYYYKRLTDEELSARAGEVQNHTVPGRILDTAGKLPFTYILLN
jgi:gamma-carbonic anhydrase